MAAAVQFFIAFGFGAAIYLGSDAAARPYMMGWALVGGVIGQHAVMFLYFWARYGRKAARSMTMG